MSPISGCNMISSDMCVIMMRCAFYLVFYDVILPLRISVTASRLRLEVRSRHPAGPKMAGRCAGMASWSAFHIVKYDVICTLSQDRLILLSHACVQKMCFSSYFCTCACILAVVEMAT